MQLHIHFLEAEGSLAPWRSLLCQQASAVATCIDKIVLRELHRHPFDVVIQYLPDEVIPELGIGGSCFRRGLVTISLDPGGVGFADRLVQGAFSRALTHELHHAMRWGACGYGHSLGDAIVSEGLADVFADIITCVSTPPWSNALTADDWKSVLGRAEGEMNDFDYDHAAWFFGTGKLPRWAGYTVGYHLARLYGRTNPEIAMTGMVDVPSSDVLALWPELKAEDHDPK